MEFSVEILCDFGRGFGFLQNKRIGFVNMRKMIQKVNTDCIWKEILLEKMNENVP